MAQSSGQQNISRKEISYYDGLNALVASNIAKKEEMFHSENVRSPMVGTVEKREGMEVIGKTVGNSEFATTKNYGLFFFSNGGMPTTNKGLYRISQLTGGSGKATIYKLNQLDQWEALTGLGANLDLPTTSPLFDYCVAENNLYIANQSITTRYISGVDGSSMTDSTTTIGNLYNCPKANLINYFKGHLYVADYLNGAVRLKSTVLRSSSQLGILALTNNDVKAGVTEIPVTDNKYFIQGETVQVYRGKNLITSWVVNTINESSIVVSANGVDVKASDEIWVNGSYGGAKVFRWVYNPSSMGVNAKDYDTFKLASTTDNNDEEITILTNVGNVMLIGSKSNLAIWNDYVLQSLDLGLGCVARKAQVKNSGALYFLHYTGIYQTNGGMPELKSSKVERYINGATLSGLENACAGKKGRNIFFCIGDVTLKNPDGSVEKVLQDVCLEYSITQENWFVHSGVKASEMTTFIDSIDYDKCVMMTTHDSCPVAEFLKPGIYTDFGKEIPMRMDTPNVMLGASFEKIAYPLEISVELERGAGVKCFVSLDMGNWYELEGEAAKGMTIFKFTRKNDDTAQPPRCRNARWSFRHNGKQLCKVAKSAISYIISNEEEMQKPDAI